MDMYGLVLESRKIDIYDYTVTAAITFFDIWGSFPVFRFDLFVKRERSMSQCGKMERHKLQI